MELGIVTDSVHRSAENPNQIAATHGFTNKETGKAFVASDDLRQAMDRAGVIGQPDLWFAVDA